jgi:hypothetical protein
MQSKSPSLLSAVHDRPFFRHDQAAGLVEVGVLMNNSVEPEQ